MASDSKALAKLKKKAAALKSSLSEIETIRKSIKSDGKSNTKSLDALLKEVSELQKEMKDED